MSEATWEGKNSLKRSNAGDQCDYTSLNAVCKYCQNRGLQPCIKVTASGAIPNPAVPSIPRVISLKSKQDVSHTGLDAVHGQEALLLSATRDTATVDVNNSESAQPEIICVDQGLHSSPPCRETSSNLTLIETNRMLPFADLLWLSRNHLANSNRSIVPFFGPIEESNSHLLPDHHVPSKPQLFSPFEASSVVSQDILLSRGADNDFVEHFFNHVCPFDTHGV